MRQHIKGGQKRRFTHTNKSKDTEDSGMKDVRIISDRENTEIRKYVFVEENIVYINLEAKRNGLIKIIRKPTKETREKARR